MVMSTHIQFMHTKRKPDGENKLRNLSVGRQQKKLFMHQNQEKWVYFMIYEAKGLEKYKSVCLFITSFHRPTYI